MKAVVFNGPWDVSVEQVSDPRIEEPNDAINKITTANICGSDLHPYEGEAPHAYKNFDDRRDGWTKVLLHPNGG